MFEITTTEINLKKKIIDILMATVENNILDPVKIKDKLFSKDTISNLNKQLLEKFNLTETNKDSKKKVIDILIKNMKVVYKSIDIKKITQKEE